MNPSELAIDLGHTTMNCTADEVAGAFTSLLHEIRSVACKLRADERVALRHIMSRKSGTLKVGEVFRDFTRESEGHKTLRRLRAAQFVRPAVSGRWDPNERIEVKPFARLIWDRVGEAEIFANESDSDGSIFEKETAPRAAPPDDEVILLTKATPEDAAPGEDELVLDLAEPDVEQDVEKAAAAIWESEDVVDLGDYVEEALRAQH